MEDVEVHEEVDVVDHLCEVEGVEHEVVDEVDSVTVEVVEVVVEEDSFQEAHQGVDVVDSVIEVDEVVDEVDTRLLIHVQYCLDLFTDPIPVLTSHIPGKQVYSAVGSPQVHLAQANSGMPLSVALLHF